MSNHNYFRKPIFLPSGGLSYPPLVWLYPISNELSLFEHDKVRSDSQFAHKLSLLDKYIESDTNIFEMYTADINYLWTYIMIEDIIVNAIYYMDILCSACTKSNYIKIDMGALDIIYLNKFDEPVSNQIIYNNDEGLIIKFSRRKAKHNLMYGHILFSDTSINRNEYIYQINVFIATQIDEIVFNEQIVPQNEYMPCLKALRLSEIDNILSMILEENNIFGINNKLHFKCKQCDTKNVIFLFNDFIESKIIPVNIDPNIISKQKELFKSVLEFSRLPIMGYREYLDSPIRFMKGISDAVQSMEFHSGSIL